MEYMGHGGVGRDHVVVSDSSVAKALDAAADKAQAYRSEEQKYTDKRQATGYQLAGPVPFGTFEVGRGSMPGNDRNTVRKACGPPVDAPMTITSSSFVIETGRLLGLLF